MSLPKRRIHLMEMDVPKIEVNGFTVSQVQDEKGKKKWFGHRGVWFDSFNERTERYTLYEVPFFAKRCKSVRIFNSKEEVQNFIAPFKERQLVLKKADEEAAGTTEEQEMLSDEEAED